VREGDTLEYIADLFGTTIEDLIALNGLPDTGEIHQGDILVIPGQAVDDDPEQGIIVPDG
jgi:LysM repeat protein